MINKNLVGKSTLCPVHRGGGGALGESKVGGGVTKNFGGKMGVYEKLLGYEGRSMKNDDQGSRCVYEKKVDNQCKCTKKIDFKLRRGVYEDFMNG